jgi:hypothetical protein
MIQLILSRSGTKDKGWFWGTWMDMIADSFCLTLFRQPHSRLFFYLLLLYGFSLVLLSSSSPFSRQTQN